MWTTGKCTPTLEKGEMLDFQAYKSMSLTTISEENSNRDD